jgi:hypothetical protein
LVVLAVPVSVYADGPYIYLSYEKNLTEQKFKQLTELFGTEFINGKGLYPMLKLSSDVTQPMERELGKYNLDVGDVFYFTWVHNYNGIMVLLRIKNVNRNGTFSYDFKAWSGPSWSFLF